jgi:hypothetical protein
VVVTRAVTRSENPAKGPGPMSGEVSQAARKKAIIRMIPTLKVATVDFFKTIWFSP